MGYEISYGPKIKEGKKRKPWPLMIAVVIALVLGARVMWPDAVTQVWRMVLPVEGETQEAFQGMVESVRAGDSLGEAVTVFCQKIIENAELTDGT